MTNLAVLCLAIVLAATVVYAVLGPLLGTLAVFGYIVYAIKAKARRS
jgi:hypothetical protein